MTDRDNQDCQGFYEVSGYTTDDGKKVESYTRRCWKHGNGVSNTFIGQMPLGQINNTNSTVNNTENKVNEFTKFVENILKQKEVSNENIDSIKDHFIDIINNLCNSIENLSVKKSKLPENPTLESVEELKNIDKERKQVYETTHKAIVTTNLAKSALEKNFKSVDTEDKDYHKKLYEHIHNKEKLKKISNSLMELFDISSSINKNSISKVNKIKEDLGINNTTYNGLTGGASNINSKNNKFIKMYKKINWSKLDDLFKAYIYAIYDERYNSIEVTNNLKEKICEELNISTNEEKLLNKEYISPDIEQFFWSLKIKNPFIAIVLIGWIWWKTNILLEEFYKRPDINITDKELDIKNEMRHITGLAFLTKIFGVEKARKLGFLKEHWDIFTHEDKEDTLVDFENNEKGIAVAIQCPNLNMEETIQKIYNVYIKPKRK